MKNKNITVEQLRKSGFKVKIRHWRYVGGGKRKHLVPRKEISKDDSSRISTFGGKTELSMVTPNGLHFQEVVQCSIKDNFNHKIANTIAIGRIFKKYGLAFSCLVN